MSFPKPRTGKECKRVNCDRHEAYTKWDAFNGGESLRFCMACKNAYVSQYTSSRVSCDDPTALVAKDKGEL